MTQRRYQAKAKFLSVMPGFVEWPAATFKTPMATLQICVHGDFSFGTSLAELSRSEAVSGHRLTDSARSYAKSLGMNRTVLARPSGLLEIREIIATPNPVSAD